MSKDEYDVLVPEGHIDNAVAEAVDGLADKLAEQLTKSAQAQADSNDRLAKAIAAARPDPVKFPAPVKYKLEVTARDHEGRIKEMTATPIG